ncbi:alpha/beta hydrolase [Rhizobium hidalgonense]|uniref:alpha/beta hydrolase n=1 Tax=Rhizobium hidalgonense TaxID=1538159 RepID=UPI000FEC8E03|nr:alpha/beta hydrolase [Rhizobium hidalgonense]RWX10006.1 alpha/beta hydrolase [Rhizobium hidalgonense]
MSKAKLEFILDISSQNPPPENASPAMMREWFEGLNAETPTAVGSIIERVPAGPCGGDLIRRDETDESRLVIYYHGGGFFFGSSRSHRVIATHLARASGALVLAADYRLAPEYPAPAAHDDAFAVYRWALAQGHDPAAIALTGDSAGGNLALSVAVRAKKESLPQPGALVLMSPALDLASEGASHRSVTDAPLLTPQLMEFFTAVYVSTGDRKAELVTPFYSDFTGLPPTLVQVGSWEVLRDDSVTLVERLKAAGGSAELSIFEGMVHSWQLFAPMLEEGMQSIEEAGGFLHNHLRCGAQRRIAV